MKNEWTERIEKLEADKKILLKSLRDMVAVCPVNDPQYTRQLAGVWYAARTAIILAEGEVITNEERIKQ